MLVIGLVVGLFFGFIFGTLSFAKAEMSIEKRAVEDKIVRLNGEYYKIEKIEWW